ncbi:penicillin acylase family protein [Segetibacter aerophilus]|uniref:Penicillin amidase n=1 Tax=Segetibacter aerophilus TaxID=670293 RepID=A0A512B6K6_9BACT|nr:penicillin acylase family protein [Segetibacter aerophilus]GEO07595.1 penicillin amidase [Segetibacter aerophilus]
MTLLFALFFIPIISFSQPFSPTEIERYKTEAQRVKIIRDTYGVPHVYGKTDADAVFGLLYAQCEESFRKVEENNLEMLGRLSEVYGEEQLYNDLEMRLIYDTSAAIADYHKSPAWLHKLLDAAADGVNYYLYKHPEVKPAVLTRFEPWFALLRTNGSISATQNGGVTSQDIKNLYPAKNNAVSYIDKKIPFYDVDPTGSNGFAVAPSKTASKNAILYINPHVTFYFRSEAQMVSEEGLQAYGAVTWGTFFVFQGFNENCGWMHTSGATDVADLFIETTVKKGDSIFTRYDNELVPVKTKPVVIRYKKGDGFREQTFTTYYTNHGPVMGSRDGKWLSLRENNRSLPALMQSWLRTKAKGFDDFKRNMDLRSNTSDNTVFADNKGNIAYWHGNYVPKRNKNVDYSLPVDGSSSTSDWKGLFALDEIVHVYNPATGFIQNCNSTPFTVSGKSSPKQQNYPGYMAPDGENFRGLNAARLLSRPKDFTIDKMINEVGYNHHLAAFDHLLPRLLKDYEALSASHPLKNELGEAIGLLRAWNKSSSDSSIASTVAIEFGYRFLQKAPAVANPYKASYAVEQLQATLAATTSNERMSLLSETLKDLEKRFGTWKIAWGEVNRYQRPADGKFDDAQPSMPVGLAAATFGSLPSFASRRLPGLNKRYGVSGNSFIACVEFGKRVRAKSIITGGQSFDPSNKHYTDQAKGYINGQFKEVLFYKEDVLKHVEKQYYPGE